MTTKALVYVIHYFHNLTRTIQNDSNESLQRKYSYLHNSKALAAEKNGTNRTN